MDTEMQNDSSKLTEMENLENLREGATTVESEVLQAEESDLQDDKIRQMEEELQDYKDRFLRNLAEMDNMRRRQEREKQETLKYATEKLLGDLLPVLDSFEKAIQADASEDKNPLVEGIRMVHKQLLSTLENHGLKAVEAKGMVFDPNLHQAIQRVDSDEVEEDTVKDEYQKGYTLSGRLIRPSMVSVWVASPKGKN